MRSVFAIASLTALFAPVGVAHAWAPNPAQQRAMAGGQPVSEVAAAADGAALLHAAIEIPASPKTVWEVMSDCRFAQKLIVTVTSCKVLQGDAQHTGWDIRETVTHGNFFVPTIHNVVRADYQPYSLIRFKKAGGDLRVEEGEWRLESLNNGSGTRVIYVNLVGANILAPAPLVREAMRKDTAKVLANLRRESMALAR